MIVTEAQLATRLAEPGAEPSLVRLLDRNAPYLVEKMAAEALLFAEATAWAQKNAVPTAEESTATIIDSYLRSIGAAARVTPEENKAYFEAHPDLFGGAKYEQVADDLRKYLLSAKQDALMDAHVNGLSQRTPVGVRRCLGASPCRADAGHSRRRGPALREASLIDFGAGGCNACDRMTPILDELGEAYRDQCNVVFASVRDNPLLGYRYGIRAIPVQVFFDAQGKEVYRHLGFFPKAQILAKLAELGIK